MRSLTAVLFDMDGTLVETEQLWGQALAELAGRLGGRLSKEGRERTVGTSMRSSVDIVHAEVGLVADEGVQRADARWVEDRALQLMLADGVLWRPGARDLVEQVRAAGLPTALVTTTPRRIAAPVLGRMVADLGSDPFHAVVCGDEAGARKPDPAPYRRAMADLGVEPSGCVVVEDSLVGVTSGLAAGAAVLGVPSLQPVSAAPGLTLRTTLVGVGVGVGELRQVLAERELLDFPT